MKFDIISISEIRITKNNTLATNIDIPGYNIEHIPTESKVGGYLLYISDKVPYKLRNDLNVYCPKQLESVFTEVLLCNEPSQIIGTICKHPPMNVSTFTNDHLKKKRLMQSIMKIKVPYSQVILTYLINYNNHNFTPQITLPTKVTEKSATLIDNIFVNNPSFKYLSGNITSSPVYHPRKFQRKHHKERINKY